MTAFESVPMNADEKEAFLSVIAGHTHEQLWRLMLSTGIRFGEAAALRWSDVDFEGGLLHIEHTLTRLGMGE